MIDINLRAPIVLTRPGYFPYLREAGEAAIVNVASLAGRTPVPDAAALLRQQVRLARIHVRTCG